MKNIRDNFFLIHLIRGGFTLAEVLVTLGIIGVVAAITLSTIIPKIEHATLQNQFKKQYTILSQALQQTSAENGNVPYQCYADSSYGYSVSECGKFWQIFPTNLKIIKKHVGAIETIYPSNFVPAENILALGGARRNPTCNGIQETAFASKTFYFLSDGAIILSYSGVFGNINFFLIDINGVKKPNKWGYDLFVLDFLKESPNSGLKITDTLCGTKEKGGYWISDLLYK